MSRTGSHTSGIEPDASSASSTFASVRSMRSRPKASNGTLKCDCAPAENTTRRRCAARWRRPAALASAAIANAPRPRDCRPPCARAVRIDSAAPARMRRPPPARTRAGESPADRGDLGRRRTLAVVLLVHVGVLQPVQGSQRIRLRQCGHAPGADRGPDEFHACGGRQPLGEQQAVEWHQGETLRSARRRGDAGDVRWTQAPRLDVPASAFARAHFEPCCWHRDSSCADRSRTAPRRATRYVSCGAVPPCFVCSRNMAASNWPSASNSTIDSARPRASSMAASSSRRGGCSTKSATSCSSCSARG